VGGLNPSGTSPESISVTAPSTAGTYYYGACVDSVSGESNTGNNCSSAVTVTVSAAPDLVVDTPTVSDSSPEVGESFTLAATVENQGSASSGSTTLRYYRSADSTISSSDTAVGTDNVGGLNPSGTSPESISVTAPSTAGTYYYGACVDSVSGESNTGNNCSSAVTVTVSAAPDLVVDTPTVSTAGTYYYGACVDSVTGESDTGNNCSSGVEVTVQAAPVGAPDLVVGTPSVDDSSPEVGPPGRRSR
jgi:hypothetical protein